MISLISSSKTLNKNKTTHLQSPLSLLKDRSPSASSRPRIEDNLGLTSDNDEGGDDKVPSESSDNSSNMDDTVVSGRKNQEWDYEGDRDEVIPI